MPRVSGDDDVHRDIQLDPVNRLHRDMRRGQEGPSFAAGVLRESGVPRPFPWCSAGPHHRRKRGVHHVLRVVYRRRRDGDHARRAGDTSFSWLSHRCRHRTMDREGECK